MNETYMQRFVELFVNLTGIPMEEAIVDADGWFFIPPDVHLKNKSEAECKSFSALNWKNNPARDGGGWWVQSWTEVKKESFISVTINEVGVKKLHCLKKGEPGQRHVYFVDDVVPSGLNGMYMLYGQFIFELESIMPCKLATHDVGTNSLYYPYDEKVLSFDKPTGEEINDTLKRLTCLDKISGRVN